MDNDNKVEIKNPQEIHDKVMLFLGEELDSLHKSTVDQLYNIDEEYEKTKKNKSPFTIVTLVLCCVFVFGVAFTMTKIISSKNKDIEVSLQEFEDLNLKGLLDTVSNAQSNYDNAVKNKVIVETDLEIRLKNAQDTYDNDVFVLDSMNISNKKTYNSRLDQIKLAYEENVKSIHEEFDPKIVLAEKEIQAYKEQLAEFDAAKVQSAREQEKALDTERKLRDLEEKRLTEKYEKRIAELNDKNTQMQKKHTEDIRASVATVSQKYQAEIDTLDPKLKDEKANAIILDKELNPVSDVDGNSYAAERNITSEKYTSIVNKYQQLYEDYKYLDKTVASIPQKYSIPKYVKASHQLVNQMGDSFLNATADFYEETVLLNNQMNKLKADFERERMENRAAMKAQQERYEAGYETMLTLAKTSAAIIYADDYENIKVYVTPKARYLVTEVGADAEIKATKAVKGKIFRNEEDDFYFVVGEDKDGNTLEVDFATIIPGTAIKILSK